MSVADLKEYGKRCAADPALAKKAKSIGLSNVKGQAEHAKTLGLNFNERDMEALAKEMGSKGELNEKELSAVAGGVVTGVAAAVVGAAAAVVATAAAVTSTTTAGGW
jgi:predicted ribosomally synthesized peptide with nif11-like leader